MDERGKCHSVAQKYNDQCPSPLQFEAPRWVERAADGSTVEVDDRSPSIGSGSGAGSPTYNGHHPLFRLPTRRQPPAR